MPHSTSSKISNAPRRVQKFGRAGTTHVSPCTGSTKEQAVVVDRAVECTPKTLPDGSSANILV
jgi:hypothetical protein